MIDSTFTVKERVVFDAENFMELLRNGNLKKGSVIVWDEAGVGIPSREWYTISNKAINYIFQTFRYRNLCLILTTPSFDFLDKQTRLLFHVYCETERIDRENQQVIVKVMENQFNPREGQLYRKYYWVKGVKKERHKIGKPTKDMIKDYEEIKFKFAGTLEKDVSKDIKKVKKDKEKRRLTNEDIQNKLNQLKDKGEKPSLAWIQQTFGIGKDRAAYNSMIIFGKRKRGRPKEDE